MIVSLVANEGYAAHILGPNSILTPNCGVHRPKDLATTQSLPTKNRISDATNEEQNFRLGGPIHHERCFEPQGSEDAR
jgi:hypothetical protein